MVEIRGFRGLRFNEGVTGALDNVVTPPYDVIDKDERFRLGESCAYNMTHLILPENKVGMNAYETAALLFRQWIDTGALFLDDNPYIYLLRQKFTGPDGLFFERKAFFALMKLPEQGEHYILGHERTFDKPVEDRLALLGAVQANLEPIFVMYSDPGNNIADMLFAVLHTEEPVLRAHTSDNVTQELWRTACPDYLVKHFISQTLYIADGHHRFKTACAWRDRCRSECTNSMPLQPYDYIMAGFVSFEEPGLKIYAAHRVVPESCSVDFDTALSAIKACFDCLLICEADIEKRLAEGGSANCLFVMHTKAKGTWLLKLKEEHRQFLVGDDRSPAWQALDVAVLHRGVLNKLLVIPDTVDLVYEKDAHKAVSLVNEGMASVAFLLRPTRPEQVRDCAEAFEPMPQKSTYFFPKLPSGTVIYPFV